MLDLAWIDDRDRFKAPMRVLADAQPLLRGGKLVGTRVVEEQKRVKNGPEIGVGEQGANGKSVSYPVAVGASLNAPELLTALAGIRFLGISWDTT
jgi:hypothetical protein